MSNAIERLIEAQKSEGVYRKGEVSNKGRTTAANRARGDLAKIHPQDYKELYEYHINEVIAHEELNPPL